MADEKTYPPAPDKLTDELLGRRFNELDVVRKAGYGAPIFDPKVGREIWIQDLPEWCQMNGGRVDQVMAAAGAEATRDGRERIDKDMALPWIQVCKLPGEHEVRFWNNGAKDTDFGVKVYHRDGHEFDLGSFEHFGDRYLRAEDAQAAARGGAPSLHTKSWQHCNEGVNGPDVLDSELTGKPPYTKVERCTQITTGGIVPISHRTGKPELRVYRCDERKDKTASVTHAGGVIRGGIHRMCPSPVPAVMYLDIDQARIDFIKETLEMYDEIRATDRADFIDHARREGLTR